MACNQLWCCQSDSLELLLCPFCQLLQLCLCFILGSPPEALAHLLWSCGAVGQSTRVKQAGACIGTFALHSCYRRYTHAWEAAHALPATAAAWHRHCGHNHQARSAKPLVACFTGMVCVVHVSWALLSHLHLDSLIIIC